MPSPAYLHVIGTKQGNITQGTFTEESVGNIYVEGHEDEILVQAISHGMSLPTDSQSGQPSGQRVHQPFVVTKVVDKSSPLLCTAMTTGERLEKCEIRLYRVSVFGTAGALLHHQADRRGHRELRLADAARAGFRLGAFNAS